MAGGEEVKLLGNWASPYVARARLALHLKGVPYEYIEEDFADKSDLLLRSNPVHKAVPVLIHGGKPVCESRVIVQYVDEAFCDTRPPLLPADPRERAAARFWAAFVDDELLAPWGMVMRSGTDEERADGLRRTVAAVDTLEGALGERSEGFFGGDRVGYVDVLLGGMVPWVRVTERLSGHNFFDASKAPLLAAWMECFGELDAARAVFQDVDRLVEYAGTIQARLAAEAGTASN
ncbi:probable glutathione S-transferase GSTU6 isoform X4 [Triticum dicoccoides]|uniref:probable glutathione S-transferase GSTU6 isoform X4 n=1 Tax=Triticum dicoccoides TaxID=85692 RepID=UPI0018912661|nr:probable glutathione S-transferase GSTU6 isoform X4 [Triticum dicoccoides]